MITKRPVWVAITVCLPTAAMSSKLARVQRPCLGHVRTCGAVNCLLAPIMGHCVTSGLKSINSVIDAYRMIRSRSCFGCSHLMVCPDKFTTVAMHFNATFMPTSPPKTPNLAKMRKWPKCSPSSSLKSLLGEVQSHLNNIKYASMGFTLYVVLNKSRWRRIKVNQLYSLIMVMSMFLLSLSC